MTLKQLTVILLVVISPAAQAQVLDVTRVELKGDRIVINYSLKDTVEGRTFIVNLYSSRDNYINPLSRLDGDHGMEVKGGNNKTITWSAKQELGEQFHGAVSIEVRARVYIPFIRFDDFQTIKRGKPKEVTWRGGTRQNILNFELYNKKGEKVHVIPNITNAGHTSLFIPVDIKPGKDYRFRIVDGKNKDQVVNTEPFTIKRKTPLLLLALPVAAVGGAVMFAGGKDSPPGIGQIPDPHDPPDGQ